MPPKPLASPRGNRKLAIVWAVVAAVAGAYATSDLLRGFYIIGIAMALFAVIALSVAFTHFTGKLPGRQ